MERTRVGIQAHGRQGRVGGSALSTLRARGSRVPINITVQWDHQHSDNAPLWCKRLVLNAVNILLPDPLVKHNGPSTLQLTLTQQASQGRWILHLLHFIPERRSDALDVIEDVIPLFNVKVGVKAAASIREVTVVPEEVTLNFRAEEAYTVFEVERIHGHAMVSLTFG
jgi:hypothetical protein